MTHEFDSTFLYIHPPLAVVGYILVFLALIFILNILKSSPKARWVEFTKPVLVLTWLFNFLGLATGMLWAQVAWGSYWSWDPKETVTLIIFIFVSLSILFYDLGMKKSVLLMLILSIIAVLVNIIITLGNYGLHSYGTF